MWPDLVVMRPPGGDRFPGIGQTGKPMHVQTVFPELAIKTFNECILGWLTGLFDTNQDIPGSA